MTNKYEELDQYLKEFNQFPLLTEEESFELWQKNANGDRAARDKLIMSNMRLVVKIAKEYSGNGVPIQDLCQEGAIGLQLAVEKFDVNLGFQFSTYAAFWIKHQITKCITNDSRTIRIPSNVVAEITRLNKIKKEFTLKNFREPSFEELLEMTQMNADKLKRIISLQQGIVSLDQIVDDETNASLLDLLEDHTTANPIEYSKAKENKEEILKVLDTLDEREKDILIKRFGLDNGIQKSLEQVGELVGLTRERVRQLELNAIAKLRHPSRAKILMESYN